MKLFRKTKNPYHPCMDDQAHGKVARIHLPVSPVCNISCNYCEKLVGIKDKTYTRPGTCSSVMTPEEAVVETGVFLNEWGTESVVGIAGPGDPLANSETFETLERLKNTFSDIRLCLCTNGLNLPGSVEFLVRTGVKNITVTVNGLTTKILSQIHPFVKKDKTMIRGVEGAKLLIENQLKGISQAVESGLFVKINTVVVPGINDGHVAEIAKHVSSMGAGVMNLMPMIPAGRFRHLERPADELMNALCRECGNHIRVFTKCRQCRADARGIPGKERCKWKKTA